MTRAETIRKALDAAQRIKANIAAKRAARAELAKWIEQDAARDRERLTRALWSERRLRADLAQIEENEDATAQALADFDF